MSSNVHESLLSECLHNMYCLLPFFHLTMCEHFSGIKYVSTSLKWLHDILVCVDHYLNDCWTVNFSTKLSLLLIGNESYNYCCIFVHILFFWLHHAVCGILVSGAGIKLFLCIGSAVLTTGLPGKSHKSLF